MMRSCAARLSTIFGALALVGAMTAAQAAPLDPYHWEKRVLILFTPSDTDNRLIAQRAMNVASVAGLRERDMAIFSVLPGRLIAELGAKPAGDEAEIAAALRDRFGIPETGFFAILVGKDGAEKARIEATLPPAVLFELIDAMPMRQREMRQNETPAPGAGAE